MRLKIFTALSLVLVFSLVFSAQFAMKANADVLPITSPVTGPVTGPITGPATLFRISGNITYHLLGIFKNSINRFMPAPGVTVQAKDIFNGHSATATTDSNGNYVIDAGQAGYYKVTVSGGDAKFYVPPVSFTHLTNKNPEQKHVNFQGLIFKF